MVSSPPTARLAADDWTQAAFEVLTEFGFEAVAVETVALRLGATKGSFYWHFANKAALIDALLALWASQTEEIIDRLGAVADPRERLRQLFDVVYSGGAWARTETELLARTRESTIAAVVEQTTRTRLDFMAGCLIELGLDEQRAADGALQAYALWIGLLHLVATVPGVVAHRKQDDRFFISTLELVEGIIPADRGDGQPSNRQRTDPASSRTVAVGESVRSSSTVRATDASAATLR